MLAYKIHIGKVSMLNRVPCVPCVPACLRALRAFLLACLFIGVPFFQRAFFWRAFFLACLFFGVPFHLFGVPFFRRAFFSACLFFGVPFLGVPFFRQYPTFLLFRLGYPVPNSKSDPCLFQSI